MNLIFLHSEQSQMLIMVQLSLKQMLKMQLTELFQLKIKKDGRTVAKATGKVDEAITLQIKNPVLWSPDKPFLYDISIELI